MELTNMVVNHEHAASFDAILSTVAKEMLATGSFNAAGGLLQFVSSFKQKWFPKTVNACSFTLTMRNHLTLDQITMLGANNPTTISPALYALMNEALLQILNAQLAYDASTMDDADLVRCKNTASYCANCYELHSKYLLVNDEFTNMWKQRKEEFILRVYQIEKHLEEIRK